MQIKDIRAFSIFDHYICLSVQDESAARAGLAAYGHRPIDKQICSRCCR